MPDQLVYLTFISFNLIPGPDVSFSNLVCKNLSPCLCVCTHLCKTQELLFVLSKKSTETRGHLYVHVLKPLREKFIFGNPIDGC